ncbi:MXAN_6577-like cysteine-rich protein [Sorangium sp. So ce1024]|uniref:MXAN_6577-like cysteine-rich protein n=1 Tax=Sorangium sp. So ce1024 TaxID=3133327 RepID=UPI003F09EFD6
MTRDGVRFRYAPSRAVPWLPAALLAATSACSSEGSPPSSAPLCDPPYSDCGGVCVALPSDRDHCGACGRACAPDELCVASACKERETDTGEAGGGQGEDDGEGGGDPEGCGEDRHMQRCDGVCVDTRTDPNHCGRCGAQCDPGRACAGSLCRRTCLEGFTECDGACVDLRADPQHCGACGNACDLGRPCEAGACGCSTEPSEPLDATLPLRVSGTTVDADDSRWPSCSGPNTGDQTFLFTAPLTGTYFFDTRGSNFDTTLAALSADTCAELACNDDDAGVWSRLTLDLIEGESILVVVSGASGAEGEFTLRVTEPRPPMCAPAALEPVVPQTVTGTTEELDDAVDADCDFSGTSPDATYTFTAPETGAYIFSARSASSELVVDVLDGATCDDESLACRYGYEQSSVMVDLEAEQTVLVAVASPGSTLDSFTLDITRAPPCPGTDLGSAVPQTVTGSNEGLPDVIGACFSPFTGGEAAYGFTAPHDGVYLFDTRGSTFPAVLELRRGTCSGAVVDCVESGASPARLAASLTAGETVVAVVDTFGETGDYRLEISEVPCPLIDLGSAAPQTVTGTTADLPDVLAPGCGYAGGPEATYRFTAPADGIYTFDTEGSAFDTILDVRDGSCAGPSIRCNDDVDSSGERDHSRVSLQLTAGQTVVVSVDSHGASGEYALNITQREAPPCPLVDLGSTVPQTVTGSNEGYPDLAIPGCGAGTGGEATYRFTAPADGYYAFATTGSSIDTVLSIHEDTCGGPELACIDDGADSRTLLWLEAEQAVVVSIDSNGDEGEYTLSVSESDGAGTCAAPIELESAVPLTFTGTTRGSASERSSTCGGGGTPEVVHVFTAPEAGSYTIDTVGSEYDTILAVFDGDCSGRQLACNDDAAWDEWLTITSEVTVSLAAGQTIVIHVDGYYRRAGHYELNIRR